MPKGWRDYVDSQVREEDAPDSGAALLVHTSYEGSVVGADALFDRKTRSFDLNLEKISRNRLGVDEDLAGMIVLQA